MIKRTLYFGNPAYLNLKDAQMIVHLVETELQNPQELTETKQTFRKLTTQEPLQTFGKLQTINF